MPIVSFKIPLYLPGWLYPAAKRLRNSFSLSAKRPGPSLWGERDVEFAFIAGHLPPGPGKALDFGSGPATMSFHAALRGYEVTAVDMQSWEAQIPWRHPAIQFVIGDVLELDLPREHFDVVLNCSAIEHVGLAGNYSVVEQRDDGDLEAMEKLRSLLKPGGIMLLTIPCGEDAVFAPFIRAYGRQRLPLLLHGFSVEERSHWVKDANDRWVPCSAKDALTYRASVDPYQPFYNTYALGCFVLRKPASAGNGN